MQAQRKIRLHWKRWLWSIPLGLLVLWQWTLFSNMIRQLFLGFLVMLAALPLMNFLEKESQQAGRLRWPWRGSAWEQGYFCCC